MTKSTRGFLAGLIILSPHMSIDIAWILWGICFAIGMYYSAKGE